MKIPVTKEQDIEREAKRLHEAAGGDGHLTNEGHSLGFCRPAYGLGWHAHVREALASMTEPLTEAWNETDHDVQGAHATSVEEDTTGVYAKTVPLVKPPRLVVEPGFHPVRGADAALPIMVHNEHTFGCIVCGQALSVPAPTLPALTWEDARDLFNTTSFIGGPDWDIDYQEFADFVNEQRALSVPAPTLPALEVHTKRCDTDCPCYDAGYETGKDVAYEECDER